MLYLQNILWGFILIATGMTLPGMVNMTAVKVSIDAGFRAGVKFSVGGALALFAQAYFATTFAQYLSDHPEVLTYLKRTMLFLFTGLSIAFFYMARQPQAFKTSNREGTPFALGFLVAGMNLVNVVFLFAMGTFLEAKGWISLQPPNKWLFMTGAALGCLLLLVLYSQFALFINRRARFFARHLNYFLSGLFVLLALIQLIQLFY